MFSTLPESRAQKKAHPRSIVMSAVTHGGIILALVAIGSKTKAYSAPAPIAVPVHMIAPVVPAKPLQASPATASSASAQAFPAPPTLSIAPPTAIPTSLPSIDATSTQTTDDITIGRGTIAGANPFATVSGVPSGGVMSENLVDRVPHAIGMAPAPRYPAMLRDGGVSGHVVVRFVIDTLGRAEMSDVQVVETTHPLFAESVRAALPTYRFSPGESGGRKVRTLVQMPFAFSIKP